MTKDASDVTESLSEIVAQLDSGLPVSSDMLERARAAVESARAETSPEASRINWIPFIEAPEVHDLGAFVLFSHSKGERASIARDEDGRLTHCLFDGDSLRYEPTHFAFFEDLKRNLEWRVLDGRCGHDLFDGQPVIVEIDSGCTTHELVRVSKSHSGTVLDLGKVVRLVRAGDGFEVDYDASIFNIPITVERIALLSDKDLPNE